MFLICVARASRFSSRSLLRSPSSTKSPTGLNPRGFILSAATFSGISSTDSYSKPSRITCIQLPSGVMALVQALRGPSCLFLNQYCGKAGICKALPDRIWCAGLTKFFRGGIISWYRQRLVLISEASPEAAPACPRFGFRDPTAHGSRFCAKKLLRTSASIRSSAGSPLPWVSIKLTADGARPAS